MSTDADAKVAAAEAKIAAAKRDVAAAKRDVAAAKRDVEFAEAKLEAKVAAAEAKVAEATAKYLDEKNEAIKSVRLSTLKSAQESAQQEVASAQQEVASAQQEVASAQTVLTAERNSFAALVNPPVVSADDAPSTKRARYQSVRYVKGVDPKSSQTIAREPLVLQLLKLASQNELVLLKGPAAVGKSSLMNLTDYYCQMNETTEDLFVPTTGYTFMEKEKDSKPALEQLKDALSKLPKLVESHEYRILFCDDIQNVASSFWEKLVNMNFLKENKLRIVGATTRRCASDPASPILGMGALLAFSDLRLSSEEVKEFLSKFLVTRQNVSKLSEEDKQMVIKAVLDQCSGHIYAIMVSLDQLDNFAQLPVNLDANLMISHLLSKEFLNCTYSRIWPQNVDDFTPEMRRELENAMLKDDNPVSTKLQSLLLKVYYIQDTNQRTEPRSWSTIKEENLFKLSARRLYCSLFSTRAPEGTKIQSIEELVSLALSKFKRENLLHSVKASDSKVFFPKEGPIQHMFFAGLTSSLPASTEVVAEMSAILPKRGSGKRGELDFYVNSSYFYGIELMRQGKNFKEHKARFLEPIAGQPASSDRGKYFTPEIKAFRVVDFEAAGFQARDKDQSRLIVVFFEDYSGCTLTFWSSSGEETSEKIHFS